MSLENAHKILRAGAAEARRRQDDPDADPRTLSKIFEQTMLLVAAELADQTPPPPSNN